MSSKPIPQGSLVLLWAGEDPAVHAALLEELEAAEIPVSDKSLGDDEVAPTADPLPIDWKPRFGFEVAVLSSDLAAAQEVLEKLLEEELADLEIPAQDGAASAEPRLVVATETHPTVEVWKGNDERIGGARRATGMIEGARTEGRATRIFPQLLKPCHKEGHLREDLECEAGSDRLSRAFGMGGGCRGVREQRRTGRAGATESAPRGNVHV